MIDLKKIISGRTVGFYLATATALLSLVTAIVYVVGYGDSEYMSWTAFALLLAAFAAFVGMTLFSVTVPWAPVALCGLDFIAFLLYIHAIYMYLSEVFYGGVTLSAMAQLNSFFVICTVFMLIAVIAGNVSVYLKQEKEQEDEQV